MPIALEKLDRIAFPMGVMDLSVHSDGLMAYAACMDGIYQCALPVDPKATDKPIPTRIGQHTSYVSGIALMESNSSLVSTSYDGTLQIRDLSTRLASENDKDEAIAPVNAPENAPVNVTEAASPKIVELPPRFSQRVHNFWSWGMALSPDERYIASVSGQYLAGAEDYSPLKASEPNVKVFDATSGKLIHAFEMLPSVQCVAFDPKSQFVAAGNLMGDLAVWEIASGQKLAEWRTPDFTSWGIIKSHCYIGGIYAVAFSPDSESLYAAGMGEMKDPMAGNGKQKWQRFRWRKTPVEKHQEIIADQSGEGLMETLAWTPSGEHFVMAGRLRGGNWNAAVFSTESGQLLGQAKTGMRITTARFSPDGHVLYLAGMQGQPAPKKDSFPSFGYLERYQVKTT